MIPHVAVGNTGLKTVDIPSAVAPTRSIGGFTFDANGALVTTTSPLVPLRSAGGLSIDSLGSLWIGNAPAVVFAAGMPINALGSLVVAAGGAIANYVNGIPVTSVGSVVTP